MAAVSHVVFAFEVMADHPRSAFRGLNSVLKSRVRRINTSGDIGDIFGLKLPIHAPFWGVFGGYFPHMTYDVTRRRDPQKALPWAETRHLSHSA